LGLSFKALNKPDRNASTRLAPGPVGLFLARSSEKARSAGLFPRPFACDRRKGRAFCAPFVAKSLGRPAFRAAIRPS